MRGVSRRRFLQGGIAAGAGMAMAGAVGTQARAAAGGKLAKFLEPVPLPGRGIVIASPAAPPDHYSFTLRAISRQLHPHLPPTPLWAYDDGSGLGGQAGLYGMAVTARSGTPLTVEYTHQLPAVYPTWLPVEQRLAPFGDHVRVLTHLHGAAVAADSDGSPSVAPDGFGPGETQRVYYPNETPATQLWFHDHAMGTTRLNLAAGLAAGYVVRDDFDTGEEPNPNGIPGGEYEIPLVIQDRIFNADGTIDYPTSDIPGVTWIGEYFGDVMLVNGKVWPYLRVEPRLYRLRILNACSARILNLGLGGVPMWQIGGDGGMWDRPVPVSRLVLAPAERADVIADFRRVAGQTLVMRNGPLPRPVVSPGPPLPTVMQVRVGRSVTRPGPHAVPAHLHGRAAILPPSGATRIFTLNEVGMETAGWFLNINGLRFADEPLGDARQAGTIEDWIYVNLTGDTHPIHPHLVQHQVVGRTPFDADAYVDRYGGPDGVPGGIDPQPFATGPMEPARPQERGFKDTTKADPGYFTTIRAKFDLPAGVTGPQTYVHHCHILEHEDNEMMRAFTVG